MEILGIFKDPLVSIERYYEGHYLRIDYYPDYANVFVYNYSLRLPLVYCSTMTKEQANSYKALFETAGYIPVM